MVPLPISPPFKKQPTNIHLQKCSQLRLVSYQVTSLAVSWLHWQPAMQKAPKLGTKVSTAT